MPARKSALLRASSTAARMASIGRAVPSYALLLVFFTLTGALGAPTTLPTLVLLAIPPILAGVHVAIREVDRDVVERVFFDTARSSFEGLLAGDGQAD